MLGINCLRFGEHGDIEVIHSFSLFDLGMNSCDLCMSVNHFYVIGL